MAVKAGSTADRESSLTPDEAAQAATEWFTAVVLYMTSSLSVYREVRGTGGPMLTAIPPVHRYSAKRPS
jgi:hypothetical protein